MARQGRGQGQQQPVRGFRPGKEPPRLRQQRAREQFRDVTPTQERLIAMFAERSPEESRGLIRRWRIGLLAAAVLLAVVGAALYAWSVVVGVLVHVLAAAVLFLWFRLHSQRAAFDAMADAVSGGGRRGRGKR